MAPVRSNRSKKVNSVPNVPNNIDSFSSDEEASSSATTSKVVKPGVVTPNVSQSGSQTPPCHEKFIVSKCCNLLILCFNLKSFDAHVNAYFICIFFSLWEYAQNGPSFKSSPPKTTYLIFIFNFYDR